LPRSNPPWPADGTVYRLVKSSAEITTTLTDGSRFVLKDPEAFTSTDPINTTMGISIMTGSQGWVNTVNAGYITGDSTSGASGDGFGGLTAETLQTLNNRSIKPIIQVELSNRTGVTVGDPSGEYPLTVQFQMENVRKLSDGSYSKLGTLTVVLQIRRNATLTYEDILLAPGKEYVRGTQVCTFDSALGTAGATISKQSAVTLQYARKRDDETDGARDHKLSFSNGDTPSSAGTAVKLPAGVTILAVDRTDDIPVYAHYTVPTGGVSEVLLSDFILNGTAGTHYSRTFGQNDKENYLFVLDFAEAPDFAQDLLCVTFEPIYSGSTTVKPARIVFNISSDPKVYKLSSPDATGGEPVQAMPTTGKL